MTTATLEEMFKDYQNDQLEYPTNESFYDYLIGLVDDGVIVNLITFK